MSTTKRIVVIGGSAAGPKAAARARRLDESAEITIVQKDPELSMASCGYPYYVGGVFDNRKALISTGSGTLRDPDYFQNAKRIRALVRTEAIRIDRSAKKVACKDLGNGKEFEIQYDKLIIATGATPRKPAISGIDLEGVRTLHSLSDADDLKTICKNECGSKAVIIGGGLIGIEACEALHLSGIEVTVVETLPQILGFLDWQMSKLVEAHIHDYGVNVITSGTISEFAGKNGKLIGVKLSDGRELPCDLALISIGVVPNSSLAAEAGLSIGDRGGIVVQEDMTTSDPDIFAVGDCVEAVHRQTGKRVHAPLGDLANLQGRVAGENAVLGGAKHPGTIQTGICKVFDFTAGSAGLNERGARKEGYDIISVVTAGPDKPGFMGPKMLMSKMVADRRSGSVLGFQCVGMGDVSRQVSQAAIAIMGGLTVDDLANADLPYAPPYSPAIDNMIATAHALQNKMRGLFVGIDAEEVRAKLDRGEKPFLLDLRSPEEFKMQSLGIGEKLIPLGALRKRLNELPRDKDAEIICFCKVSLRGYEGARVLMQSGWNNVKVLEGGIATWPYPSGN